MCRDCLHIHCITAKVKIISDPFKKSRNAFEFFLDLAKKKKENQDDTV